MSTSINSKQAHQKMPNAFSTGLAEIDQRVYQAPV